MRQASQQRSPRKRKVVVAETHAEPPAEADQWVMFSPHPSNQVPIGFCIRSVLFTQRRSSTVTSSSFISFPSVKTGHAKSACRDKRRGRRQCSAPTAFLCFLRTASFLHK